MTPKNRYGYAPSVTLDDFCTEDPVMAGCLRRARIASATDLPVLIQGESGTGKTLLARAIHNSSSRAGAPFISFNSAALSETLLDSQLFGHERGAFTGAESRIKGKFELSDGGTLFIDEIADMSATAQSKILRVVEYGELERLGSETLRLVDVRLISATHFHLPGLAESGRFRQDLYFRLTGITVTIPPLRDRRSDFPLLLSAEIGRAARKHQKPIVGLDDLAAERLFAYRWPGNLRELNRVIDTAVAVTATDLIKSDALFLETACPSRSDTGSARAGGFDGEILTLAEAERSHILRVLEHFAGNKRRAAYALNISRSTLDRKLAPSVGRTHVNRERRWS